MSQKSMVEEEIETLKINFEDLIELAGGIESKSSKLSGDLTAVCSYQFAIFRLSHTLSVELN